MAATHHKRANSMGGTTSMMGKSRKDTTREVPKIMHVGDVMKINEEEDISGGDFSNNELYEGQYVKHEGRKKNQGPQTVR